MSILINGMEMPEGCFGCPLAHRSYNLKEDMSQLACYATDKWTSDDGEKPDWCPLIEVPQHGRLIDADALMLQVQEYIEEYGVDIDEHGFHSGKWCAMKETEMVINDAPTVIPADEDGET